MHFLTLGERMTISPCDVCENRQEELDPQGCFRQVSSTGTIGRASRSIFGCERFRDQRERITFKLMISEQSERFLNDEMIEREPGIEVRVKDKPDFTILYRRAAGDRDLNER